MVSWKNAILIGSYTLCLFVGVGLFVLGSKLAYLDLTDMTDSVDSLSLSLLDQNQQRLYKYDKLILYLYDYEQFQGNTKVSNLTINDCPKSEYEQLNITNNTIHFNPTEDLVKAYPDQSFEVGVYSDHTLNFKRSIVSLFTGMDVKQLNQLLNFTQFSQIKFRNLIKDIQQKKDVKTFAFLNKRYQKLFTEFLAFNATSKNKSESIQNRNFQVQDETSIQYNLNSYLEKNDYDVLIFSKSTENLLLEENKEDQLSDILEQKKTNLLSVVSQINKNPKNVLFLAIGWNQCHKQAKIFAYNRNGFSLTDQNSDEQIIIDQFYGSLSYAMNWEIKEGLIARNIGLLDIKQQYMNSQTDLLYRIQDSFNNLVQQYKFLNKLTNLNTSSSSTSEDQEVLSRILGKMKKIYENYSDSDKNKVHANASMEDLKQIETMQIEIELKIKEYSQFNLNLTIAGAQLIFFSIFICLTILMVNMKVQDSIYCKRLINLMLELPIYYEALKFLFNRLLIPEFSLVYPESTQQLIRTQQFELQEQTFYSILFFMGIIALLNSTTLFIQQQYQKILLAVVCYNLFIGEAYLQRNVFLNATLAEDKEQLAILLLIIVRFLYELYSTMGESLFYLYYCTIIFLLPFLRYFFEASFIIFQYVNAFNGIVLLYLNRAETNFEEKIAICLLSFSPFINFIVTSEQCSNFFFVYSSHIALYCLLFCFAAYLKILYLPAFFIIMNILNYELLMNIKIGESEYSGFTLSNFLIVALSLFGVSNVIFWSKAQQMHKKNFNDLTLSKMFSSDVKSNQAVLIAQLFKYNLFGIIALLQIMFFIILQNAQTFDSISVNFLEDYLKAEYNNSYINYFQKQALYTCATLVSSIIMVLLYTRTKEIDDFDNASKSEIYETEELADNSATRKGFDIIMASEKKQLNNNSTLF
ncbi:hypothetical protein ABPG74_001702 [Tetrahymena malaccensis]